MPTAMYYSPTLEDKLVKDGSFPAVILPPGGVPTFMTESRNDLPPMAMSGDDEPWRNVVTLKSAWQDAVLIHQGEFSKHDAVMLVDGLNKVTEQGAAYAQAQGFSATAEAFHKISRRPGPARFIDIAEGLLHGAGKKFNAPRTAHFRR